MLNPTYDLSDMLFIISVTQRGGVVRRAVSSLLMSPCAEKSRTVPSQPTADILYCFTMY